MVGHTIICVDSKNMVYRHGWTRAHLTSADGKASGAIFGALSCLIRLHKHYPSAKFVFCWDGVKPRHSWRHRLCPTYKSNRAAKPSDIPTETKAILSQIGAIKKALSILGFPQFEIESIEADDLIGVISTNLAKRKDVDKVLIYSMDKDFFGLISEKIQVVRDLDKSEKCKAFSKEDVLKTYGVQAEDWVKYRALIGDPSDCIKSPFPKIGKIRAIKLLGAGLDPSKQKPTNKVEKPFKKYWAQCHMNYRVSKIVTNADHRLLPIHAKESLKIVVTRLKKSIRCVERNAECRTKMNYKKFLSFCSDYDLNWIIENRHVFWTMGW